MPRLDVVDQPARIGALPIGVTQAEEVLVGYLPGLAMRRIAVPPYVWTILGCVTALLCDDDILIVVACTFTLVLLESRASGFFEYPGQQGENSIEASAQEDNRLVAEYR
jgi:hypothetical protein